MTGHCQVCHFALDDPDETVCRRCARNFSHSELRQVIALALAAFILARLSFYLITGSLFAGLWKGSVAGPFDLSNWGHFPVNMVDYPWHFLTIGCLLGLLFVIPILVATMFGPKPGIIVALVIGFFAGIPWLFLFAVPSAYIAGTRLNGRLSLAASAWLAMVLPLAYGLVMTWNTVRMVPGFVTVWIVVIVLGCAHVVLTLLLLKRGHIGGAWLVKLILPEALFVLALFYFTVGFDTVEYEYLRNRASLLSDRFTELTVPASGSSDVSSLLKERTERMQKLRGLSLDEFSSFVELFPRSPLAALAFYEQTELLNLKLYYVNPAPAGQAAAPTLVLNTSRISPEAGDIYRRIVRDFNNSVPAAYARLKQADFEAQHGQVGAASFAYEDKVLAVYATHLPNGYTPPDYNPDDLEKTWRTQRITTDVERLAYYDVMQRAKARRDFIARNSDYNDIPLILYLEADPLDPDFAQRGANIIEWFPSAKIVDNVLKKLPSPQEGS